MSRMLNNCDETIDDLVKETQKLMKDVGYYLMDD
jgi:hypothetical protein